jgi:hypothetical protein
MSLYGIFYSIYGNINTNKISFQLQANQCHATGMDGANNRHDITPGNLDNVISNTYFESTDERIKLMISDPHTRTTIDNRLKCYYAE